MYSELCNWCFTQLEHKYVCFSSNSCRVLHGENAIGTNKRACKLRGGLASTSALAITKRIIDIMLNFFFNPLTIQVFEEAHLLGSGISQEQNINDSIIWRIAEGQGASEECTLRQGSENQHLSHTSAYFRGFLHLSQDCTVLLSWAGFGHTKKSRVFPTVLQGRVQSNFPFTSQKKKKKRFSNSLKSQCLQVSLCLKSGPTQQESLTFESSKWNALHQVHNSGIHYLYHTKKRIFNSLAVLKTRRILKY